MKNNEVPYFALNPDYLDGAIQCCSNDDDMFALLENLKRVAMDGNNSELIPFSSTGTRIFFNKMCEYAQEKATAYSKRISGLRQYRKNDHPKD